ncbi:hypothetical protein K0504_08720 [Neiella marina]|uniref:Uncharacterized protein n=1 Tax=Neiella holothuriorum TaxID=2870530 RepID=A0ABS7EFT4_9GAMM|nr:hypothetical protein [Neiella holothuriorum]MBW8191115.1 hypothetical protein [Neiella holothuriorum]
MNPVEPAEIFGYRARIQLSFHSYMQLASFISVTFACAITFMLRFVASSHGESRINLEQVDQYITLCTFIGFLLFNLLSAALSYLAYRAWCRQRHGLQMTGKFAVPIDSEPTS